VAVAGSYQMTSPPYFVFFRSQPRGAKFPPHRILDSIIDRILIRDQVLEELLRVHSVFPDSRKFLCFIPDPDRVLISVDRRPAIGIPIGLVIAEAIWLVTLK
jgi:hypothetical protein